MGGMGAPSLSVGGRFDPTGLGNAMVSAVREGVDRFGSPVLPGAGGEGGVASSAMGGADGKAGEAKANLNENLKNIGKFFRRDVGGFRGFGRSEEGR